MRRPWGRLAGAALVAVAVTVAGAPSGGGAEPADYVLDPDHTSIGFLVEHVGFAKVLGMFRESTGSFRFDAETGELSDVRIVVRTESVFTDQADRDRHLKSADFLDCERFPEMVFAARGATLRKKETVELAGELTLLGKTRPLTLQVVWNKSDVSPLSDQRPFVTGISARGAFRRSFFGMEYGVANGWVGDEVALILELEAWRQ